MRNSTGSSTGCWRGAPKSSMLFLVGSCPSEVIKLDLSRAAAAASREASRRTCASSTIRAAASRRRSRRAKMPASPRWCPGCRRRRTVPRLLCSSSARCPISSRTSSRRLFAELGIPLSPSCRSAPMPRSCRLSARTHASCWRSPFLGDTARALEERGATCSLRCSRLAPKARHTGCTQPRPISACHGDTCRRRDSPHPRQRAQQALAHHRERARKASASSSFPTRSSNCRWRVFSRVNSACS